MKAKRSSRPDAPLEIKRGNVSVKIYSGKNRVNGTVYPQFTLTYYDGTHRKKKRFASLADAKREAEFTATKLANGENEVLRLTSTDRTIYVQAITQLQPLNIPLNLAVMEYVSAVQQLPPGSTLKEAVDYFRKRNPAALQKRTVQQVVAELLDAKRAAKLSDVHVRDLEYRLNRFAEAFHVNIGGVSGMVVSIDKATALRMHDKVRKHWAAETQRVQKELAAYNITPERKAELSARLDVLSATDMALIVSPGQNEVEQMKKLGLDIVPHRQRLNDSQPPLDEKFKDATDPLRLVFVCAMWLTGFDAPSCSTVYLDKPMRNHTLMQTIARANRVFPGKHNGMIVDYANVFASLEKALAIYGVGKGGSNPVRNKSKLVADLRNAIETATKFCASHQVILPAIEQLPSGSLARLQRVDDAVNALISPDPLRREFFGHERIVTTLYAAVKPDPAALEFSGRVACLGAIAEAIRAKLNPDPADISAVMGNIARLLDASITGVDMPAKPSPVMDLSKIDFQALSRRFKESKQKNTDLEVLKAAIRVMLERLIRLNKTRADFAEKFEELIDSYNAGSRNIEELFEELLILSRSLSDEQQRHVRESLSEEELVIFDILTRPAPALSTDERAEVKKVARDLLNRLKQLLVLNWRQKSTARSQLRLTIEDILDTGLPRAYDKPLYEQKCSALFEHFFESYPERDNSIYLGAA